jgi:hypothetical protein
MMLRQSKRQSESGKILAGFRGVNEGVIVVADQLIRAWHLDKCCKEVTNMLWLLLNAVAAVADFCSQSPVKVCSHSIPRHCEEPHTSK